MICEECFLYAVSNKGCVERHNIPAAEEKCYYFTPQVKIPFSREEIWAVVDMLLYVREREENAALSTFYDKIRMVISPSQVCEKNSFLVTKEGM